MPHEHEHGHSHAHTHAPDGNVRAAFFLNLSFTVLELAGGLFTNSIAILSDAVHDLGDSLSLGLAWYFQKLSRRGSTTKYTYGYKRFSLLGAIINSAVLLTGSVYILSESVPRLFQPQETDAAGMFVLSVVGILVNGAAVWRTRKGKSLNERVVSLHLLEDVLGWAAVLVGSIVMYFTGLTILDPILSVAISCFVLVNVVRNIRQMLPILLQGTPADVDRERVAAALRELGPIREVHDLHIWSLDETYNVLTVHAVLAELLPAAGLAELKRTIRHTMEDKGIQHVTVEFESPDEGCTFEHCGE
jgi:cobalt-zinc-cadmium efflux system protein